MRKIWAFGFLVLISSCKLIKTATVGESNAYSTYQEDLSGSLPVYPDYRVVTENSASSIATNSVQSVDAQLEGLEKRFAEKNKSEPYFNGYTVLVFSGIDRVKAFKTQDDLIYLFPNLTPDMQYQQPRYLVKIGQYTHKIEAQKIFSQLKGQFPSARIIQDRFQRKEYGGSLFNQNATNQN